MSALAHRGPDDAGVYSDSELALGNRRLSIIDIPGGRQPIVNEDGSLWITFNGEIYNYRELHASLAARGHRFATESDTEVILHLYEERGAKCLEDLRGMFAFAVWNKRKRRLFLARDRLGVKPLFYRVTGEGISFASELAALERMSGARFETEPQSVYDYFLLRYVPAPRTLYRGVHKLLPGEYLHADALGVSTARYWDVPAGTDRRGAEEDLGREALERLTESIRLRLIADAPIGAFLSGGLDSSALVALMAKLGARPLRTFSVGFDQPGYSELPYARSVAALFATEHHELIIGPGDFEHHLPRLVAMRAEPVAEPTDVALFRLAQCAAETVKVVLAGEGGDETFAGYPKYAADPLHRVVARLPFRSAQRIARALPYRMGRAQLALEALSLRRDDERIAAWFGSFTEVELAALFTREFLEQIDPGHAAQLFGRHLAPNRTPLKRMLYTDLKIWLPDNLLLRGDHMTMAASIEERVPFLDHQLVEFAAAIPDSMLVRRFKPKAFLRRMLRNLLPEEILNRRKVGFTAPAGLWFRGALKPMIGDLVLSPQARWRAYFNPSAVERLVAEHFEGARDRRKQLWPLLNFELWQRERERMSGGPNS